MKKNNNQIIIIVSEFYPELSELLLSDCTNHLIDNGIKKNSISIYRVSGVFEIPGAVNYVSKYNSPDAIITLGVVIKGKTPHFDFISKSTINAIMHLSIAYRKPIGNGIITCLNKKQALIRSNPNKNDKGGEACRAMLSVLDV